MNYHPVPEGLPFKPTNDHLGRFMLEVTPEEADVVAGQLGLFYEDAVRRNEPFDFALMGLGLMLNKGLYAHELDAEEPVWLPGDFVRSLASYYELEIAQRLTMISFGSSEVIQYRDYLAKLSIGLASVA